ncbi:MAG: carboxylesterase family protein [Phenylobacterium sp.]|jgi:para-nitrobenzyl esterase|uniref:Carboxylic ester hydrolase n=1 Tax=Brevundimonas mediterranea TaxID=74329 RepID=A0AB37EBM8_9CAUL|nr:MULTISPECIES: carboxylesterase family protein [Brevundimonas]MBA4330458.1 carboxylesterase [Brevundimonas sp.]MDZ4375258.1 carboxylesterase family protein [Phenylobacterium sp.]QIH74292.1 carboxylesterase family protein [Brevundimonas mediterranea]TAJ42327.1 MAG: carboxylesterase family protein [Brevundimonas sp.]
MTFAGALATLSLMMAQPTDQPPPEQPVVQLAQGVLAGRADDTVAAFKNIPYAAPPVAELRWRPPGAAPTWEGRRDASTYGPICIQATPQGDPGVGPLPMSEDCLNLNVWRPTDVAASPAPVMVWIHGGGLVNGSGTAALYDGSHLARQGMVVVSMNYRLGRLGFFDHPALAAERPADEAAGNYGLMDVIAALQWVRANIAVFGGDPANVTIFGESAGGAIVTRMMISPPARGLFDRAIVQSGLGRELQTPLDRRGAYDLPSARERGEVWAHGHNLLTAADLRAAPVELLLTPAPVFANGDLSLIDGRIVPSTVEAAFRSGRQAPVPMVIGTNSAEFWWMKPTDRNGYGMIDDDLTWLERATITAAYGGEAGFDRGFITDAVFSEPARRLARLHAAAGHPAYLYRFDISSPDNPEPHGGATHAIERPYVFGTLPLLPYPVREADVAASAAMMGYWTAFSRSGDPNGVGRPDWPMAGGGDTQLMLFRNDGPSATPVPDSARLDLIERFRERSHAISKSSQVTVKTHY